uniref:NELL2-interacting cell ontogeny regulator 1 n=1 Tax=Anser brachyrhynchus TaxID=132585 RepID=A0A8B9BV33_9AVES
MTRGEPGRGVRQCDIGITSTFACRQQSQPAFSPGSARWPRSVGFMAEREAPVPEMLAPCLLRRVVLTVPLVFVAALLLMEPVRSDQEAGTAIPAESRPCVDCHAFEFMQRALQDLKKTAYNLDTRTESLLLRAEKRGLCDCFPAIL